MRTSQIAMLAAGGVLVGGVLVLAVAGRLGAGPVEPGERRELGERVSRELALERFSSVVVSGSWSVQVEQGPAFSVTLSHPEGVQESLVADVRGEQLVLASEDAAGPGWSWFGGQDLNLEARVVVPSLENIAIDGAGEVVLRGLSGERLAIAVAGAANVEGSGGRYDALDLDVSGAGRVELAGMEFRDANIDLSGAANVTLTMAGGVLSGSLSGVGRVEYFGTVQNERIVVSGFGRVEAMD